MPQVALEAHALGNLEGRDDAPLDFLAGFRQCRCLGRGLAWPCPPTWRDVKQERNPPFPSTSFAMNELYHLQIVV
jgi:hypothetical protein